MTFPQWKAFIKEFIDRLQEELGPLTSIKTQMSLSVFQKSLDTPRSPRERKHFEQELEAFIDGNQVVKRAAERYLRKKVPAAMKEAVATILRANAVLEIASLKKPRRVAKLKD